MIVASMLTLQKSKPRRIVLEETDERCRVDFPQPIGYPMSIMTIYSNKIWRMVVGQRDKTIKEE